MDGEYHGGSEGNVGGATEQPALPQQRWSQQQPVRALVGTLTAVVLLGTSLFSAHWWPGHWSLTLPGGTIVQVTQRGLLPLVALLLMPFMPLVSYRKRDVLLVALVPVIGPMLAGIMVYRLLSLPRRDWPPRPDESDRVVRLPDERHTYLLMPTFALAETLRTAWCVSLDHHHPYPSWRAAQADRRAMSLSPPRSERGSPR